MSSNDKFTSHDEKYLAAFGPRQANIFVYVGVYTSCYPTEVTGHDFFPYRLLHPCTGLYSGSRLYQTGRILVGLCARDFPWMQEMSSTI